MDCQTARCTSPFSQMEGEWKLIRRNDDDSNTLKESQTRSQQPSFNNGLVEMDSSSDESDDSTMVGSMERKSIGQCQEEEEKFDKTFVMVLLKYLELKDLDMRKEAIAIIKDCGKRKGSDGPGHGSAKDVMRTRLMELVGEHYWKEAENLQHLTKLQQERGAKVGLAGNHFDRCFTLSRNRSNSFDRKVDALRLLMQSHHLDGGGHSVPWKCSSKVSKMLAKGWANEIRRQYRNKLNGNKLVKITDEQIEQLESVGFLWERQPAAK